MLDQVKQEIVTLCAGGTVEVPVEALQGKYGKPLVLEAMKALQKERQGTLIVGRHGHSTRFKLGTQRTEIDPKIKLLAAGLENVINKNREAAPNGTDLVVYLEDLEKQFPKAHLIEAFRMLEANGLGIFCIGRKGWKTRFEVGRTREERTASSPRSSSTRPALPPPEDGPLAALGALSAQQHVSKAAERGYRLMVNCNVVFTQANVPGGHATLREAFDAANLKEVTPGGFNRFEKAASRFGFVLMEPVGICKS